MQPLTYVKSRLLQIALVFACIFNSFVSNLQNPHALGGSVVKNPPANAEAAGLIPGSGRSPGGGHGNPLQYSCLGNPRDRGDRSTWPLWTQQLESDPPGPTTPTFHLANLGLENRFFPTGAAVKISDEYMHSWFVTDSEVSTQEKVRTTASDLPWIKTTVSGALSSPATWFSAALLTRGLQPGDHKPTEMRRVSSGDQAGGIESSGEFQCPQQMNVESESEVAQSSPTLSDPMDRSLPGSSIHGIFLARVLEWGAIVKTYMGKESKKSGYVHT
ncbi:hypothetical protein MG293_002159 [Ovis ammon polii]|uniref:Uncharacterized protein n=1 Tax=Ovis ammon polii TaxID=230172 RepID=A0AAD4US03_OVIAM|nr:hypothetical protein MG293_002159 [Ovis ammon polii]